MRKFLFFCGALCILVVGFYLLYSSKSSEQYPDVVAGEIVVDFKDDVDTEYIMQLGRELSINFSPESDYSSVDKMYVGEYYGEDEDAVLKTLQSNSRVEAADREMIYTIPEHNLPQSTIEFETKTGSSNTFPNDPLYSKQWAFAQMHMPKQWDKYGGNDIIIAVLDTGFTSTVDMKDVKLVKGWNFVSNNADTTDGHSHGTFVSSCAAGNTNNKIGVAGIAYRAKIMPVKVLSDEGSGSSAGIAQGIHFAVDNGAKILNLSLGGGGRDATTERAIKYAYDKGCIVVCAAGNSSRGQVSYPAKYIGAIAVAATQRDEKTTFYSNWGKEIAIAAPGGMGARDKPEENVLQNTIVKGRDVYAYMAGTSFSSPYVAGVAALIVEQGVIDPDKVRDILVKSARVPSGVDGNSKSFHEHFGAGIVDAASAVNLAKGDSLYTGKKIGLCVLFILLGVIVFWLIKRKRK